MEFSRTDGYLNWMNNMRSVFENVRRRDDDAITFRGQTYDAFRNWVSFNAYGGEVFYVDDVDKNDELVVDKKSIDDFLGEFKVVE